MDILAGLSDKLRFIERFYESASNPFRETKRKIESGEEPFTSRPFDPETVTGEPEFLEEWIEADDSLNLVGQAALNLVQTSLREYLDAFIFRSPPPEGLEPTGKNWVERRKSLFLEAYAIDWASGPVPISDLEEINLTRNDIQHTETPFGAFGLTRRQSDEHRTRFPHGLFVHEIDRQLATAAGDASMGRIYVTRENLKEAIQRVERFCEFLEEHRPY